LADCLVIIPTFNEIENIEAILREIFATPGKFNVLVVDDNSPDETAKCVQELQGEFKERLFLEIRRKKSGLGTAYIHGFKWALNNNYTYIFEMDADFSHNPEDLPRLYEACATHGADVAIGSRYIKGVNVVNWPMTRVLMSWFASKYVKLITGIPIQDTTAGFVCFHRKVLESINLDDVQFVGYAFQIEMKFKAYLKNFEIIEIPVIFTDRVLGESKLDNSIVYEAIFGVIKMKVKSWFGREVRTRKK
jgi:dolichol-phosphate mannosyltransferase